MTSDRRSLVLPPVQTRVQGIWPLRGGLHSEAVQAPVWSRQGRVWAQVHQEHQRNV